MATMEEPSVLDYVKSKLTFWKQSAIEIPEAQAESPVMEGEPVADGVQPFGVGLMPVEAKRTALPVARTAFRFPWLSLAPLGLALVAQALLEPPERNEMEAAVLYFLAAVFVVVAYLRADLCPELAQTGAVQEEAPKVRVEGLAVAAVVLLIAFFAFGPDKTQQHKFNFLNLSLWLVGTGYLVWAFWEPGQKKLSDVSGAVRQYLAQPHLRLSISRWGLLLLIAVGVVLFFRFYRLDALPGDMVSDHAEKLLDVGDVLDGQLHVFFPRNTGREAFQFYWTALMAQVFGAGISFMSLKLGTVLGGLVTLYYMYRLGSEIGNRWVALYALLFAAFGYWPNIISRIGLRFPLYPLFLAPLLFHLVRGLRRSNRNDFIWAGLWLGAGLHGYTSFRIVPFLVVAAFALFLLHEKSPLIRKRMLLGFLIVVVVSFAVFMPLFRYAVDDWDMFNSRSMTRIGSTERPLPGPAHEIFIGNLWNALTMFFYKDGDVWVHSVPGRPAMDVVSAALMFVGLVLVLARYVRRRNWVDLFMLSSLPILLMPSILSLAFPNENPNLNRTAGAYVPAFIILAIGLDALLKGIQSRLPNLAGKLAASIVGLSLLLFGAANNYDLVFNQYDQQYRAAAWNTSEMGSVITSFEHVYGAGENAWVLAYPYWVDTRLVGINAGYPRRDTGISPDRLVETMGSPGAKLFLLHPEDMQGLTALIQIYPEGRYWPYDSQTEGRDFLVFLVPPSQNAIVLPSEPTE